MHPVFLGMAAAPTWYHPPSMPTWTGSSSSIPPVKCMWSAKTTGACLPHDWRCDARSGCARSHSSPPLWDSAGHGQDWAPFQVPICCSTAHSAADSGTTKECARHVELRSQQPSDTTAPTPLSPLGCAPWRRPFASDSSLACPASSAAQKRRCSPSGACPIGLLHGLQPCGWPIATETTAESHGRC